MSSKLIIIIIVIVSYQFCFTQLTNKWILSDSLNPNEDYRINITHENDKSFAYYDKNNIAIIAYRGFEYIIRKTTDGGSTWNIIFYDSTKRTKDNRKELNLIDIEHPSKNKIIIIGYNWKSFKNDDSIEIFKSIGTIKYSDNKGNNWNTIYFDTNTYINNFSMTDSLFGVGLFRQANKYLLIETEDGLKNYKLFDLPSFIKDFELLHLYSYDKKLYLLSFLSISENKYFLFKTTDGGINWLSIQSPKNDNIIKMKLLNENLWFILYKNDFYSTNDGGESWKKFNYFENNTKYSIYLDFDFSDKNNGIIIDWVNGVYHTIDGGKNWIREFTPDFFNRGSNAVIIYPSQDTAFIGYSFYKLYQRTKYLTLIPPVIDLSEYNGRYIKPYGNKIHWNKIIDADKYELLTYEQDYDTGLTTLFNDTLVRDTSIILDLNYKKSYFFQIRAYNDTLSSEISPQQHAIQIIRDSNTLTSPKILYPNDYNTPYPTKLTALWTSDEPVDSYDIKLYKELQWDSPEYLLYNLTNYKDTNYYFDNLAIDTNLYLLIRSNNNEKISGWSLRTFYTTSDLAVNEDILKEQQSIIIIPNPTSNIIRANLKNINGDIVSIKLYNSIGIEIINFDPRFYKDGSNTFIEYNISNLCNGIYFLLVRNKNKRFTGAFVVNK